MTCSSTSANIGPLTGLREIGRSSLASMNCIAINCIVGTDDHPDAIDCTGSVGNPAWEEKLDRLLTSAVSDATRRAYQSDLRHFEENDGRIPSTPEAIATYIASMAFDYAPATVVRRIASLSKAHKALGVGNPTQSEIVRQALRGMKRVRGMAQRQAKPLLKEDLFALLETMGDNPKDIRDRALLLVGFAGGFRRSELVGLDVEDVEPVRQGMIFTLRRSKSDQLGKGRRIGIPFGRTQWCPVTSLEAHMSLSDCKTGAIFRNMSRRRSACGGRLSGEAVSLVLKKRLRQAGIDPCPYSGHSLRAGFATSAAIAGASTLKIRQQTGHSSDAMLSRYIRESDLFVNNAAGAIL